MNVRFKGTIRTHAWRVLLRCDAPNLNVQYKQCEPIVQAWSLAIFHTDLVMI